MIYMKLNTKSILSQVTSLIVCDLSRTYLSLGQRDAVSLKLCYLSSVAVH